MDRTTLGSLLTKTAVLALLALLTGCVSAPQQPVEKPVIVFPGPPDEPRFYYERTIYGTADVKEPSEEQRLRMLLTGLAGASGVGFAKPFDIAVQRGRVFVTDTVSRAVVVLDFLNGNSFQIGDKGDSGDLYKPLGLALDRSGQLYVVDGSLKTVLVYDAGGNFLRTIGNKEQLDRPSGVDVSPDGDRVFVVDTGGVGSRNHRVVVYDGLTGEHIRDIATRGSGTGELNLPRDVKMGPDGNLYVTDGGNFRVQVFSQEGEFVREWGKPGRHLGQFSRPKGISVDRDGFVYVVDAAFGNFQIFSPDGALALFIGNRSTVPGPAKYMLPAGIDVDEDGRVYMVDQFFRKIDVYRPSGIAEGQGYLAGVDPAAAPKSKPLPKDQP